MAIISLNAASRVPARKGAARKLRATGNVPAVVYAAGSSAVPLSINPRDLELGFASTKNPNTLVELVLADGPSRTCVVKEVQRHPVSKVIEHVDFYEVTREQQVVMEIPLVLTGRAAGTRVGGALSQLRRSLTVKISPFDAPATIEVDITPLNVGQALRVSQIAAPAGGSIIFDRDFIVAEVQGTRETAEAGKGA